MTFPAIKKNVLEELLLGFWMFKDHRDILTLVLRAVENGSISIEVSNLKTDNWDATFRFKVNDLGAYGLMRLIGPMVERWRPDELSMSSDDIVRMRWD
jgi:hypothetical protein